jgi:hypothetical protein
MIGLKVEPVHIRTYPATTAKMNTYAAERALRAVDGPQELFVRGIR